MVRLTIDTAGRVDDCDVTASSGSRVLDSTTCRILKRRARFEPAWEPRHSDRGYPETEDTMGA